MPIKANTDVFTIREGSTITLDFTSGQSESQFTTVSIPTQLDTLGREVLMIQEVDFDIQGLAYFLGVMARADGSVSQGADQLVNGNITVTLTEVDPNVDPNALLLESPHFIASREVTAISGWTMVVDDNPDTASYSSVAAADHPLFTSAASTLFLTVSGNFQGNDPGTGTAAPAGLRGMVRIMAQRGKADADTYAAIVTGLYA